MKRLTQLIEELEILEVHGSEEIEILSLESDSRRATQGSLFVAVKGVAVDGHQYIDKAIAQGAAAIVCEMLPDALDPAVSYLCVADSAAALGLLASAWHGYPSQSLTLVGVTGTNGKTTIATLLYDAFRSFGYRVGLLSTVCNYVHDRAIAATHTTPDPLTLNALLAEMVADGCEYAFMEVSSHSVDQQRIAGLQFAGGLFTNITRDHLDYHKTFDAYLKAKKRFFDLLPADAFALSNIDDRNGEVMLQNCRATKYYYGLQHMTDYHARILESHFEGMLLEIEGQEVYTQFVGRFNAYNLMAVYGALRLMHCTQQESLVALSTLVPVAGRFQTMRSPKGVTAIVDYAHTPDALKNVLSAIHGVLEGRGRVITVVGAGGNRDKGKRPLMAKEAIAASDTVVITSDNPRNEEPDAIIADMMEGVELGDRNRVVTIADRRSAIQTAIMLAQSGDVVLIAGKGHEDYQEINGVKHHFSDKEVVEACFA